MTTPQLDGGFANLSHDAAHAFRAALQAMARPGRIEMLALARPPAPCSQAAGALILTLCDSTTPLYLAPSHDQPGLREWITFHTSAPIVRPEAAMFALGTWDALSPVDRFAIGTSAYPDRAATLIVEMTSLATKGASLRGPGIKDRAQLSLPEIAAFQDNRRRFPLGFDCYFTCGDRLAGLPRGAIVEG
ncbi:phosphonate C-P lyase system protein PhnH [Rhodobacterales bacterium LSUCC0031]|nr:phosphonate C-P lyase system protein PhnH [Rhodobacterales bacterium LSUCC0031]